MISDKEKKIRVLLDEVLASNETTREASIENLFKAFDDKDMAVYVRARFKTARGIRELTWVIDNLLSSDISKL